MAKDLVADLLTRVRNAQMVGHRSVRIQKSKLSATVLGVLKAEGFIGGYEARKNQDQELAHDEYEVQLKYFGNGEPVIAEIERVSTSGRRMYTEISKLPKVYNGLGIWILSTSEGVMSDRLARKKKVGGEILARVSC